MPELPEVETVARGLAKRVTGEVIESVWIGARRQPLKSPARLIADTLEHKRIASVGRMGKHIVFELAHSNSMLIEDKPPGPKFAGRSARATATVAQWVVHLGMTGRMLVCDPDEAAVKHTHLVARLGSGKEVRFIDPRMFGKLQVVQQADFDPGGREPLETNRETFLAMFRGRKTPIKSALLNQKLLRGVGNIYADEALARAGIRPRRRASSLTRDQLGKLFGCVQKVLREAIELGGSSVSDYVGADGEEGFFQLRHRVYGREGEPCQKCKTAIRRVVIAGRSSHYCPKCQK
jgi:formamidopyrimidine-DNA glycosylase